MNEGTCLFKTSRSYPLSKCMTLMRSSLDEITSYGFFEVVARFSDLVFFSVFRQSAGWFVFRFLEGTFRSGRQHIATCFFAKLLKTVFSSGLVCSCVWEASALVDGFRNRFTFQTTTSTVRYVSTNHNNSAQIFN